MAASSMLSQEEYESLVRPRLPDVNDVRWSDADAALLDEARALLGPKTVKGRTDAARVH